MKKILFFLLAIGLLSACERDANIDVPAIDPMVSVTCYISPQDTMLSANVTRVNPIFGDDGDNNNFQINNAVVTISDGSNTATLLYNNFGNTYSCDADLLPILPGQTYTLRIEAPGYPLLTAHTTVPMQQPSGLGAVIDQMDVTQTTFDQMFNLVLDVSWNDIPQADSYYKGVVTYTDTIFDDDIIQINSSQIISFYEKDDLTNQGRIEQKHRGSVYFYEELTPDAFHFHLINCTKEYYEFHKSIENLSYSSPFSEASPIYSNTIGGLGVFAAYQKSDIWIIP